MFFSNDNNDKRKPSNNQPDNGGTGKAPKKPASATPQTPITPPEQIDADRLIEASIASLKAIVETADSAEGPWAYPADLMGAPNQPRILCDFTRDEISEASMFLVRLGIIERPKSKPGPRKG